MAQTCITCRLTFSSEEEQKAHFKTELHIENSRRSAKGLLPMTNEEYIEFMQLQSAKIGNEATECAICQKEFKTRELYEKHVKTQKHVEKEKLHNLSQEKLSAKREFSSGVVESELGNCDNEQELSDEAEQNMIKIDVPPFCNYDEAIIFKNILPELLELDEQEQDDLIYKEIIEKREIIPSSTCLFCQFSDNGFTNLMKHMEEEHGFFIPQHAYAREEEIVHLLQKIMGESRECILCGRQFFTLELLEKHMMEKSHTVPKLGEFEALFADFYDFSASYPQKMIDEAQNEPELLSLMKLRPFRAEKRDFETRFQLNQGGKVYNLREWYNYKKAHVSELAAIRIEEQSLLKTLQKMGPDAIVKADETQGNQIVLTSNARNLVGKINSLAAEHEDNKFLLRITDEWLQQEYLTKINEPDCELQRLERREVEDRRDVVSEGINHFKPHFKKSTLYMRGDK